MWYYINEEIDDKSFMKVERVSWGWNSFVLFSKYKCDETLLHCFQNINMLKTEPWNLYWDGLSARWRERRPSLMATLKLILMVHLMFLGIGVVIRNWTKRLELTAWTWRVVFQACCLGGLIIWSRVVQDKVHTWIKRLSMYPLTRETKEVGGVFSINSLWFCEAAYYNIFVCIW